MPQPDSTFDPDKFLAQTTNSSGGFNPDKFLSETTVPPPEKPVQPMDTSTAAVKGIQNFGTFGLSPLLAGVGGAIGKPLGVYSGLGDAPFLEKAKAAVQAIPEGFSEGRAQQKQEEAQASSEHPAAYYGAGIPTSLLTGGALGAIAKPIQGGGLLKSGLQTLSQAPKTLGAAAKAGALAGGLQAVGSADTPLEAAKDVAVSTALSPVAQLGANYLGKTLGGALKTSAETQAFRSLGPYTRQAVKSSNKGEIQAIGRTLLDEGIIGKGTPKTYEVIAEAADAAKERAGQKIGSIIDEVGEFEKKILAGSPATAKDIATKAQVLQSGVNRDLIADSLEKELVRAKDIPGVSGENEALKELIAEFRGSGGPLHIKSAQDLKVKIGKMINWDRLPGADIPLKEEFYRSLYNKVNKGVEDSAEGLAKIAAGSSRKDQLQAAKKIYGHLDTAVQTAEKRDAHEIAKRILSPSDYGTGAAGAALGTLFGGPLGTAVGGLIGAGANKVTRKYGAQIAAGVGDVASRGLMNGANLAPAVAGTSAGLLKKGK